MHLLIWFAAAKSYSWGIQVAPLAASPTPSRDNHGLVGAPKLHFPSKKHQRLGFFRELVSIRRGGLGEDTLISKDWHLLKYQHLWCSKSSVPKVTSQFSWPWLWVCERVEAPSLEGIIGDQSWELLFTDKPSLKRALLTYTEKLQVRWVFSLSFLHQLLCCM